MKAFIGILLLAAATQAQKIDWSKLRSRDLHYDEPFPTNYSGERIINGQEASPLQFPFMVSLILDGQYICGASLISVNYVMTTAQCIDGISQAVVFMGAYNIQQAETNRVTMISTDMKIHEKWNSKTHQNDIGIIKLPNAVTLDVNIQLVNLPAYSDDVPFAGDIVTFIGWGKISNSATSVAPILRYFSNPVISNAKCILSYGSVITNTHVCLSGNGDKSPCGFDNGGPLMDALNGVNKQIGIYSFQKSAGCGTGAPSVYTRVTKYLSWIAANSDVTISQ